MLSFKLLGGIATLIAAISTQETSAQDFCIHGVNYNPRVGPDWAPVAEQCKSAADIQVDMATLAPITRSVRLFGLVDCDQELAQLQALIQQNPGVFSSGAIVDIHVGSEAIYRKEVTAQKNIEFMNRVKTVLAQNNLSSIPVTIAEIGDVYLAHPELTAAVDFVQANGFPFWERIEVESAVSYFESRMAPLYQQAAAVGKKVVIGETGWASSGSDVKASVTGPSNAARYFSDFYQMAEQQNLEFYYFEAFDEEWKITASNTTVEGYFGLFHADRTLKTEFAALSLGSTCSAGSNEEGVASSSNSGSNTGTNPDECHVRRK
ncbi:hypothetical protein BBJ29_010087 [Phytophthora kernoviae]|uniref:glucan endo-1,3-beta-D-glucosidase n=1 Tax=Phytophthora kernoviae TaxID=325452 RepID=A0A3F2RGD0_9STRA|nr:hypothetical protein BBJ29_010087 [Phytophthora kernoviae]RLN55939.1 hypothetical protein BBP00_00008252 [Phytophthora kernoviae]